MEIRNVNREDLDNALAIVNQRYNGNIRFKNIGLLHKHTKIGSKQVWNVTLTVNSTHIKIVDSVKPRRVHIETLQGVKVSRGPFHNGRRIAAACWHVHGHFFDALPADCIIISGTRTYDGKPNTSRPGDAWNDFPIGSAYYPCDASQACECIE